MHHKRRRPRSRRAGCLMCKYYKHNAFKDTPEGNKPSVRRKLQVTREEE